MKYTKELLEPIIKQSQSWAEVCRIIGIKPATGAQTHLTRKAISFGIDHSHFIGKAYNRGKISNKRKNALEHCFKGSTIHSHKLKLLLIRDGYKEAKCELCNITHWFDKLTPLELHHIDKDHSNNEISNLELLCPNCHSYKHMVT